jgi:hypothetical protein
MAIRIYAMTHKKFEEPEDEMYVPLHVGRAQASELGYLGDNTGDNISNLNCYYSELTGIYWLWKNVHDLDYIGICHYRRYLLNKHDLVFQKQELLELLETYDVITSKCISLDYSYRYGFGDNHNVNDLDETGRVIKELYPEYYETFIKLVNESHTYFGNICVMAKPLYDQYCEWLFSIFSEVQKRIDVESYDSYHKRVFGFISEFLLYVWVTVNQFKAYECKVGLIGEKAETKEVKTKLAKYFLEKDIQGAKTYFLDFHAKRPDILMEASDVTGDLRVCMQIIATAEAEQQKYHRSILNRMDDFKHLVNLFKVLNSIVIRYSKGIFEEQDQFLLKELRMTPEALEIAVIAFCKDAEKKETVLSELMKSSETF